MKHLVVLFVVAGSLLAYSQTSTSLTGQIRGRVIDRNGSPVSGATVYAVPQGLAFDDIAPRSVKTDESGAFYFRGGFQFEAYRLYSRKEEESYPDARDAFYADPKADAPKVEITADHPSATVTLKLGEKAGVIAGRVIDAETGAVMNAGLYFYDGEGHGHRVNSSDVDGTYRALLPPGKEVKVMVMDLSSHTVDARLPVAPLRVEPGQYVYMDIQVSR